MTRCVRIHYESFQTTHKTYRDIDGLSLLESSALVKHALDLLWRIISHRSLGICGSVAGWWLTIWSCGEGNGAREDLQLTKVITYIPPKLITHLGAELVVDRVRGLDTVPGAGQRPAPWDTAVH